MKEGKYNIICFLFAAGFFFCDQLRAQSPAYYNYDASSGLTCNEVYDVLQDKKGFIWTATDRGIFRFDGYSFQAFTTAQGLTDNTVFRIEEDLLGRIWAMPFNGELCYIENDRVVAYPFNDTLSRYLKGVHIARSLCVLPSGALRIGYLLHGVVEISDKGIYKLLSPDTDIVARGHCTAIDYGGDGLVYGIRDAKYKGDKNSFSFSAPGIFATIFFSDSASTHQQITGIRRRAGGWCVATKSMLFEISTDGKITDLTFTHQPLCVYEDAESCLWVGMENGGIRRYAPNASASANEKYETFFPGESVSRIIQDSEGSFWMATLRNGLFYMPSVYVRSWRLPQSTNDELLSVVPGPQQSVYTLWRGHGLFSIKHDVLKAEPLPADAKLNFNSVTYDTLRNELLLSAIKFTARLKEEDKSSVQQWFATTNMLINSPAGMYSTTAWNIRRLDDEGNWKLLGDPMVRCRPDILYTDHARKLWMGTIDGLYYIRDTSIISCTSLHPLFTKRIAAICELEDHTLVVATQSNGIVWMKDGKTKVLLSTDGIPTDHVLGIAPGKGNTLWISTTNGLYSAIQQEEGFKTKHFSVLDGLLQGEGRCSFVDGDGKLWMNAGDQIIRFDPAQALENPSRPPVYLSSVMLKDSVLSLAGNIELPYNDNSIRITFAGLAYRLQGHARYRYRIHGKEETWNYTFVNTVELAALEPGDYRFEVEAENENGQWSELPATYTFTVHAPFWERGWFIALVFCAVTIIVTAFILYRFRQLQRHTQLREQAQEFRQEALASQMNPHFIFNSLNTIQTYVLQEDKIKALELFSSFASFLRKSLDHARERYITLSQEVEMLKLYFDIEKLRFEERLSYTIVVGKDIDADQLLLPSMLVQPLVENAIRHGIMHRTEGGKVEVRFIKENNKLVCEVEDNGVGRVASALYKKADHRSAGSTITEDRLRVLSQMNGSEFYFEIRDNYNENGTASGTLIRFSIPSMLKKQNSYEATAGAAY
jgi:ligand-binding sensor domain-containing protein/two-component sensor histidine kinase